MVKKILTLIGLVCIFVFLVLFYLVYFSKSRGYYQVKLGLMEAKTFKIKGRVIDQYDNPVKNWPMQLKPFFEAHPASWTAKKIEGFKTVTNENGEFVLDTSPVKITGTFVSSDFPQVIDGEYYDGCYGWDIFTLYKGQWIRDARWELPQPVPHDENKEYIFRVAHRGPPQRMIKFYGSLKIPNHKVMDEMWLSVDVLKGEVVIGEFKGCDLIIHITNLREPFERLAGVSKGEWENGPAFEFIAQEGGGVQFQKVIMEINNEAPEEGYEKMAKGQGKKIDGKWQTPWMPTSYYYSMRYPMQPIVYFNSRNGLVFGVCKLVMSTTNQLKDSEGALCIELEVIANPRGERNLNYGSDNDPLKIPLPVTLPFKEDVPFVDRKKIWAYEDPEKENTIIVEGEKGAVEKGAWVSVFNNTASDERVDRHATTIKGINIDVRYVPIGDDGTFKVSLYGREENVISVYVAWPYGVNPQTGHQGERGEGIVQLAPRWRLKEKK